VYQKESEKKKENPISSIFPHLFLLFLLSPYRINVAVGVFLLLLHFNCTHVALMSSFSWHFSFLVQSFFFLSSHHAMLFLFTSSRIASSSFIQPRQLLPDLRLTPPSLAITPSPSPGRIGSALSFTFLFTLFYIGHQPHLGKPGSPGFLDTLTNYYSLRRCATTFLGRRPYYAPSSSCGSNMSCHLPTNLTPWS